MRPCRAGCSLPSCINIHMDVCGPEKRPWWQSGLGVQLAVWLLLTSSDCNPSNPSPAGHGAGEGGGDVRHGRNVGGKHPDKPRRGQVDGDGREGRGAGGEGSRGWQWRSQHAWGGGRDGLGRWELRWALFRAELPVRGERTPRSTPPCLPRLWDPWHGSPNPGGSGSGDPHGARGGSSDETQPRCATVGTL